MFISEHTSSGMSVNIDIELSILSMLYNQTYILYLISCTYYIKYCIEDSICPGGLLEDLHGHNCVFVVLS